MRSLIKLCIVASILTAMLVPLNAESEVFNSLEHGFSVEYPGGLDLSVYNLESEMGMESPIAVKFVYPYSSIYIGAYENPGIQLADYAFNIKSKYEENEEANYTIVKIADIEINGTSAISMEGILDYGDTSEKGKIRDVLIGNEDTVYQISCRATITNFARENRTHFNDLINSFQRHSINDTEEENLPGFPKRIDTGDSIWSSAALADIIGDSKLEIIFGANDGKLHALGSTGEEIDGFPVDAGNFIRSSPAVADIDEDGAQEIAVGCDDGKLYVFKNNGTIMAGFPKETDGGITSSPAIADLDSDGVAEIVVGSLNRGIYAWHSDGSVVCGFPVITFGDVWSSPAIGDLNADGKNDVVIGSRKQCNNLVECFFASSEGKVFGLDYQGNSLDFFPKQFPDEIGYSSPILSDLDNDGELEIIFAGTHALYVKKTASDDDIEGFPVKVGDANSGTGGIMQDSFIAVGDLDDNGEQEIVAGATDGRVYVWKSDGSNLPGFPIQTGGYVRHVTIGDINGDGMQEILGGSSDHRVHVWTLDGTELEGFPKVTLDEIQTAPTIGDLEGNGSLELIVGSNDGGLYVWKISNKYGELDWPMIRQNLRHTSNA